MRIILKSCLIALGTKKAFAASDMSAHVESLSNILGKHCNFGKHQDVSGFSNRYKAHNDSDLINWKDYPTYVLQPGRIKDTCLDEILIRRWHVSDSFGKEIDELVWINLHSDKPLMFRCNTAPHEREWWFVDGEYNWRVVDTKVTLEMQNEEGSWQDVTPYLSVPTAGPEELTPFWREHPLSEMHPSRSGPVNYLEGCLCHEGLLNQNTRDLDTWKEGDKAEFLATAIKHYAKKEETKNYFKEGKSWRLRRGKNVVFTRKELKPVVGQKPEVKYMHTLDYVLKTDRWEDFFAPAGTRARSDALKPTRRLLAAERRFD